MKNNEMPFKGSGFRAMESNQDALEHANAELEKLKARAEAGENVDKEIMNLRAHIKDLKEDQGRINMAA